MTLSDFQIETLYEAGNLSDDCAPPESERAIYDIRFKTM